MRLHRFLFLRFRSLPGLKTQSVSSTDSVGEAFFLPGRETRPLRNAAEAFVTGEQTP